MIPRRYEPSTSHHVSLSAVQRPQTWTLSAEANKKCGTCSVCLAIRQLHIKDGTVHKHGPRDNPCSGSHQPPLSNSVHLHPASQSSETTSVSNHTAAQGLASTSPADVSTVVGTSSTIASVNMVTINTDSQSTIQSIPVKHHGISRPVLKRIPKGARPVAAKLLQKLIQDVLLHSSSSSSWSKLLGFPSACLSKPNRGGKSRNLTTLFTNQIIQYDNDGSSQPVPEVSLYLIGTNH